MNKDINEKRSSIVDFYKGKSVFITGGTGFLGTVLVEKLLYSCEGINKIYVLVKQEKGKTFKDKFFDYLNSKAFIRIKEKNPAMLQKLIPINGNVEEKLLGISENDLKVLQEEVAIVFHGAAKLLFNMSLATAVNVNTRPTQQLIAICQGMRKIAAFVYISSAYSNVNRPVIDEKVYKTGVSLETVYSTLEANNAKGLAHMLLDGRPNTYTYSKALTEEIIENELYQIPAAIVRPSIIASAVKEPVPGWIHGWHGFSSAAAAACKGDLVVWHANPKLAFDVVPVDLVANLLIASAWDTSECRDKGGQGVKVYNCCSGLRNPTDLDYIMKNCVQYGHYFGSEYSINRNFTSKSNNIIYIIWLFFYQIIPAIFLDALSLLTGKEPVMINRLKKIVKLNSYLEFFTTNQFLFLDSNVRALIARMAPDERVTFDCDITNIQWDQYLEKFVLGMSKYMDS